jgi:hypothetical protein
MKNIHLSNLPTHILAVVLSVDPALSSPHTFPDSVTIISWIPDSKKLYSQLTIQFNIHSSHLTPTKQWVWSMIPLTAPVVARALHY